MYHGRGGYVWAEDQELAQHFLILIPIGCWLALLFSRKQFLI
jgi:hypothetical protein